jgi:hypothetical protein
LSDFLLLDFAGRAAGGFIRLFSSDLQLKRPENLGLCGFR